MPNATKYLLRRRNRFGRYEHLATYPWDPDDNKIRSDFGPGQYSIYVAEEGIIGLRQHRDVLLPWNIDYLEEVEGLVTTDYIQKKFGIGNYFVLHSCRVEPHQIYPTQEIPQTTWNFLQDGASAMRNISVIYRVHDVPWLT